MRLRRVAAADSNPRDYLDGANRVFGHWGDEATFAWVFRGGAELLFLDDEQGRPIAASGITYRMLRGGHPVAIMTGSWTSPESRGRGAFTRMIEATREAGHERGAVVLGFVRQDNVSSRRLEAAGAAMVPTFYCRSIPSQAEGVPPLPFALLRIGRDDTPPSMFPSSFVYSMAEWRAQFLERPHAQIECIGRRGEWVAIVERAGDFDRVHAVSDPSALPQLAARAHAAGRRLFWFAFSRPPFDCEWTDGFLGAMPELPVSDFTMQNGDRM
jgi:hypothetical protein